MSIKCILKIEFIKIFIMTDFVLLMLYNILKEDIAMDKVMQHKNDRILGIYTKLINGNWVNKTEEAKKYGVNERTIQRDIDDIRNFLELYSEHTGYINKVIYNRSNKGYLIERVDKAQIDNSEIFALCKILLESRAFTKEKMTEIVNKLIISCVPKNEQKLISKLINNEIFHYIEPQHKVDFTDLMWDIGKAICESKYIEIEYERTKDKAIVKRKLKPVAIMFSEYYFYLTAFIDDEEVRRDFDIINDSFPTIYRVDRIKKMKILNESFYIPYSSRFEEGEFRKRIQFMYGGKLQKVKFKYLGNDINAVLDRLPTAKILSNEDGVYVVSAEVFGKGIDMWLRSQGDNVELL